MHEPDGPLSGKPRTTRGSSRASRSRRVIPGLVLRLAERLGVTPDELAERIPPDTLRRTQYPVRESVNPDGTRTYEEVES